MEDTSVMAAWVSGRGDQATLLVPTKKNMEDIFNPNFWKSMDPRSFIYGDGVYGIERDTRFSYQEYLRYLFNRDELEYDSIFDGSPERPERGADASPRAEVDTEEPRGAGSRDEGGQANITRELPRWAVARDLQTAS